VYDPDGNALVLYEQDKQELKKRNPTINVLVFRDYDKATLTKIDGESYESFQKRAQRRAARKRQKAQAEQAKKLAELYRIDWDIERWKIDVSVLFKNESSAVDDPPQNLVSPEADHKQVGTEN
jgi:hypothetical protein